MGEEQKSKSFGSRVVASIREHWNLYRWVGYVCFVVLAVALGLFLSGVDVGTVEFARPLTWSRRTSEPSQTRAALAAAVTTVSLLLFFRLWRTAKALRRYGPFIARWSTDPSNRGPVLIWRYKPYLLLAISLLVGILEVSVRSERSTTNDVVLPALIALPLSVIASLVFAMVDSQVRYYSVTDQSNRICAIFGLPPSSSKALFVYHQFEAKDDRNADDGLIHRYDLILGKELERLFTRANCEVNTTTDVRVVGGPKNPGRRLVLNVDGSNHYLSRGQETLEFDTLVLIGLFSNSLVRSYSESNYSEFKLRPNEHNSILDDREIVVDGETKRNENRSDAKLEKAVIHRHTFENVNLVIAGGISPKGTFGVAKHLGMPGDAGWLGMYDKMSASKVDNVHSFLYRFEFTTMVDEDQTGGKGYPRLTGTGEVEVIRPINGVDPKNLQVSDLVHVKEEASITVGSPPVFPKDN